MGGFCFRGFGAIMRVWDVNYVVFFFLFTIAIKIVHYINLFPRIDSHVSKYDLVSLG